MGKMIERLERPDTYAVWSKNETTRFYSTSGGAFTEFAKYIINNNGIVVGAKYNKNNMVEHAIAKDLLELEALRQSKYISSNIGNIFIEIKKYLNNGILVGFCGSPCQVAGLYAFLGKNYDNLVTMDFICRGMNSPKALRSWLSEIEEKENKKITRVWFKYKEGGWKTSPTRTRLDFEDGSYCIKDGDDNLFMKGYLTSNFYIRPCCGNCKFKGFPRKSDITFADFWGIDEELDDDKGTSLLLINSKKGKEIFESITENFNIYRKSFDSIFGGNPMLMASANVPEKGYYFLKDLDIMSFSKCYKKYNKVSIIHRAYRKIKKLARYILKK